MRPGPAASGCRVNTPATRRLCLRPTSVNEARRADWDRRSVRRWRPLCARAPAPRRSVRHPAVVRRTGARGRVRRRSTGRYAGGSRGRIPSAGSASAGNRSTSDSRSARSTGRSRRCPGNRPAAGAVATSDPAQVVDHRDEFRRVSPAGRGIRSSRRSDPTPHESETLGGCISARPADPASRGGPPKPAASARPPARPARTTRPA